MRLERIGSVFAIEKGTLQSTKCIAGDFDFITASREWKSHTTFTHEREALVIAVAASGSLGRTHYVNGKFIASDLCFILTPKGKYTDSISLPFYQFVFNGLKEDIVKQCATGTAKQAINQRNLANYRIPYFEPEEQGRMSLRLKAVFASQEILETEISRRRSLLAKLKQTILQEAIQGRLTAEWRAAHPDTEPASQLLSRVRAERATLIAARRLRPQKPLPNIAPTEIPFEVPKSWEWSRLDGLAMDVSYGTSQKAHLEAEGIPVLRMGNITSDGDISYLNLKYVSPKIKDLPRLYLAPGDIVFNRTNSYELVGKSAVYRRDEPFTLASYLIRVRLFDQLAPEYVAHFINSAICRTGFIEPNVIQQNGQANFNGTKLKTIPIPVPPLAEQAAIVAQIGTLTMTCRALDTEIDYARACVTKLLQAVLKEALTPIL